MKFFVIKNKKNPGILELMGSGKALKTRELYEKLVREEKILQGRGQIRFRLKGIEATIKSRDVIGGVIQDWLAAWMQEKGIKFSTPENTQDFPDFFLNPEKATESLLEIKTFDSERGANFDIANFESYCRSLLTRSYRLDADYIIFSYAMDNEGWIRICDVWLKKIWEISGPSGQFPIKVQQKQNMIYNLRPIVWYSKKSKYKPFRTLEEFLMALNRTLTTYGKTKETSSGWLASVVGNYKKHTNVQLF